MIRVLRVGVAILVVSLQLACAASLTIEADTSGSTTTASTEGTTETTTDTASAASLEQATLLARATMNTGSGAIEESGVSTSSLVVLTHANEISSLGSSFLNEGGVVNVSTASRTFQSGQYTRPSVPPSVAPHFNLNGVEGSAAGRLETGNGTSILTMEFDRFELNASEDDSFVFKKGDLQVAVNGSNLQVISEGLNVTFGAQAETYPADVNLTATLGSTSIDFCGIVRIGDTDWDICGWIPKQSQLATLHVDADGDGYTTAEGDCNDNSAAINPGATEVCNGNIVDENCDGDIDEGFSRTTYNIDVDGDGYGSTVGTRSACSQPVGYVSNSTDCDDGDSAVNPGLAEVCNDGKDNDCDGTSNSCDITGTLTVTSDTLTTLKLVGEGTVNGYAGNGVAGVGDTNNDGYDDLLVAATHINNFTGKAYLIRGGTGQTGSKELSSANAFFTGESTYDYIGNFGMAGVGDINGDNNDDFLISASGDDDGGSGAGAAYLIHGGSLSGTTSLSNANAKLTGEAASDTAGSVVGADVDNDGVKELVVGAQGHDYTYDSSGAVYIGEGSVTGSNSLSTFATKFTGPAEDSVAGHRISAGDVNGDGYDDLLISVPNSNAGIPGDAYLVYGPLPKSDHLGVIPGNSGAGAKFSGTVNSDNFGRCVNATGDINGDGYKDMVFGAYKDNTSGGNNGAVFIKYGQSTKFSGDINSYDVKLTGEGTPISIYLGIDCTVLDFNGDGKDDVVFGNQHHYTNGSAPGPNYVGAAYLFYGPVASGTRSVSTFDAKFLGVAANDYCSRVSSAGDFNGDGKDDLLMGCWGDDTNASAGGAAYLIYGKGQ